MPIHKIDSFFNGDAFNKPNIDISPKIKDNDPQYSLDYAQYIYSSFYFGNNYGRYYNYYGLRAYADGRQDPSIYKRRFMDESQTPPIQTGSVDFTNDEIDDMEQVNRARAHYMEVDFNKVFSPAPKFVNNLVGKFTKQSHVTTVKALDKRSVDKKTELKWSKWADAKLKPVFDAADELMGTPPSDAQPLPSNLQELELYDSMGGFRPRYEVAMEKGLVHTEDISDFGTIKDDCIRDFVTIGRACYIDRFDTTSQKVMYEYVDPDILITDNFRKPSLFGIQKMFTIADLRIMLPELNEEQFRQIAKNASNKFNNIAWDESWETLENLTYGYDDYRVPVLYCAWETSDAHPHTTRTNKKGEKRTFKEPIDNNGDFIDKVAPFNKPNRKTVNKYIKAIYHCHWVMGTKHVFDYGRMNNIAFDPKTKQVHVPLHVSKLRGKSIMESMIPLLDQIQMTYLRLQNAIAKAPPDGLAIDIDAIKDVSLDGGKKAWDPLDIIRVRSQEGHMFYRGGVKEGRYNDPRSGSSYGKLPIEPLKGGLGTALDDAVKSWETSFQLIADLTGVDRVSSVTSQDPRTSAEETKRAASGTNDTLQPVYSGWIKIKRDSARSAAIKIQVSCATNKDKTRGYVPVLGEAAAEALALAQAFPPAHYGFNIEPGPTAEEKAEIRRAAADAQAKGILDYSDYLLIVDQVLNNDGLNYAKQLLSWKENQAKREAERVAADAQNRQAENDAAIAQQKAEADKVRLEQEGINEANLETVKGDQARQTETLKAKETRATNELLHQQRMDELRLELEIKEKQKVASPTP